MPFVIDENVTITLKESDLKELIKEALVARGYVPVSDNSMTFSMRTVTNGYGRDEYDSTVFDGVTIKVRKV